MPRIGAARSSQAARSRGSRASGVPDASRSQRRSTYSGTSEKRPVATSRGSAVAAQSKSAAALSHTTAPLVSTISRRSVPCVSSHQRSSFWHQGDAAKRGEASTMNQREPAR